MLISSFLLSQPSAYQKKKIETSLTIASDWHPMMLTKMAKSFLTALRPHQHFFPLCRYQRLFRPTFSLQKSLLSAHFCHVRGWVSGSRGRKGVSPSECCMLSWPRAESVASLPFYFAPLSSLLLPFWSFDPSVSAVCSEDVAAKATLSNTLAPSLLPQPQQHAN